MINTLHILLQGYEILLEKQHYVSNLVLLYVANMARMDVSSLQIRLEMVDIILLDGT